MKGQIVAAGDLPQAGDAGLDAEPLALNSPVEEIDIADRHRPGAHQAHFTAQHIEQLRQLVQAGPAQPSAHPGHPGVVGDLEDRP